MRIGGEGLHWIVGYFIMAIGGYYGKYGDDVELAPLDPILYPVPDCLTQLNPFPVNNAGAAAGLDYSGKFGLSSEKRRRPQLRWEESLFLQKVTFPSFAAAKTTRSTPTCATNTWPPWTNGRSPGLWQRRGDTAVTAAQSLGVWSWEEGTTLAQVTCRLSQRR